MQKIHPFLWFDHQAEEAVKLYTSLFDGSKILSQVRYGDAGPGPRGTVMTMAFQLMGQDFVALNGGPVYAFTPALSLFVSCASTAEVDRLWGELSRDGKVFMELQRYPFSEKFGWCSDRYGLSWQLNLTGSRGIAPFFLFVGAQCGKAEQAMRGWASLFRDSAVDEVERWGAGQGEIEGTVSHGRFSLAGERFMAMDSHRDHPFSFTPALSLVVNCEQQQEIDELWERLSVGGKKGPCGWLEDRYGVSWQIVPTVLPALLADAERAQRVMKAILGMTKLDIAALQNA